MAEKILITGASGFIGGYLVDKALELGFDTYAGIRKSSNTEYLQDERIKFCYLDYEDLNDLSSQLVHHKFDYIIHNAGITKAKEEIEYYKVNAGYLQYLVQTLQKFNIAPTNFVYISSLAAYGPAEYTKGGIVKSESEPHPVTTYGKSKLAGEKYLQSLNNFTYNIVRPTAVYGPREQDLLTVYKLINKHLELQIGFSNQKLTFIYVEDLVEVIFHTLLQGARKKGYFVSDGRSYSAEKFHRIIKESLKKSTIRIKLPIFVVEMIGYFSEQVSKVTKKYPALNKEKVNELKCQSWVCDVVSIQEDFNFVPKFDLRRGMEKTITWNKEKGLL